MTKRSPEGKKPERTRGKSPNQGDLSKTGEAAVPLAGDGAALGNDSGDHSPLRQRVYFLVVALFFASGLASLIYQVVWTKVLVLVFGASTFATATVLAIFMAGLALGSYLGGRMADRVRRPFWCYGVLEGIIGVWALLAPGMFTLAVPLYKLIWQHTHLSLMGFSLLRFLETALILLVPTTCMGATLPLLSRFVSDSLKNVGDRVGTLYAANTLGAICGATGGGFLLLPTCGMTATTAIAAGLNFVLAGLVYVASKQLEKPAPSAPPVATAKTEAKAAALPTNMAVAIACFAVAGATSMIYEVGWTRALLLVIGSSTYAFTVMLTAFLIGIFAGSLICAKLIDRAGNPLACFAFLQFGVCVISLVCMYFFQFVPYWNLTLNAQIAHDPVAGMGTRFLQAFAIMVPFTLCIGATFPAVVRGCTQSLEAIGRSIGIIYAANTFGAIIGAFATGFLLMPWLGAERSLALAAIINGIGGCILLGASGLVRWPAATVAACVACALGIWLLPNLELWDRLLLLHGQAVRRVLRAGALGFDSFGAWQKAEHSLRDVLYFQDGACSNVGIFRVKNAGETSLSTNGHIDASDMSDMPVQTLLGGFPLLFKPDAQEVAVIGWGGGVTVGTATLFPVKSIDAIELEPAVIAASKFFHHVNHAPENDPRVKIEFNDGRNLLMATDKKFDVLISEPSNPWQPGVCNLFTREYFQICQQVLNPGGIFCMWSQIAEVPPSNIAEILRALHDVFPQCVILKPNAGNIIVLASDKPILADLQKMTRLFAIPGIKESLANVGVTSPAAAVAHIVAAADGVDSLVAQAKPNTDDLNRLEYQVGMNYLYQSFVSENDAEFNKFMGEPWRQINWSSLDKDAQARQMSDIAGQALALGDKSLSGRWSEASLKIKQTIAGLSTAAKIAAATGNPMLAEAYWSKALALDQSSIETKQDAAVAALSRHDSARARALLLEALKLDPSNQETRYLLANAWSPRALGLGVSSLCEPVPGQPKQAAAEVLKHLQGLTSNQAFVQKHPDLLFDAAEAHLTLGHLSEAEPLLKRYLELAPGSAAAERSLAQVLCQRGDRLRGTDYWFASFYSAKAHAARFCQQAEAEFKYGNGDEAVRLAALALELYPGNADARRLLKRFSERNAKAAEVLNRFAHTAPIVDQR